MKKISLLAILLATACANLFAQTFEGTIRFRTMENKSTNIKIPKKLQNLMDIGINNGSRNAILVVKGNKMLMKDDISHLTTLYDPENNTVTTYSELINKGFQSDYTTVMSTASMSSDWTKGDASVYEIESQGVVSTYENKDVEYVKVHIERDQMTINPTISKIDMTINTHITNDIDIYKIDGIHINQTFNDLLTFGLDAGDGLVTKLVSKSIQQTSLGETMTYDYIELTNIEERPVDDSEFEIPAKIEIDKSGSPLKNMQFLKEYAKYLEKNNMLPRQQVNTDVVYRIDEEWDF